MRAFVVYLANLQDPITPDMLTGCQGVLRFTQNLRRGYVAEASITIKNPGLSLLTRSTYVAVLVSQDDTPAGAKVICRARINAAPESANGPTVTIPLVCAPASHAQDLRAAANASVAGAGILPYIVRVVPTPDPPGSIAVAFATSPATAWAQLRGSALRAQATFQEDIVRTPLRFLAWKVMTLVNARLIVTLNDSPALRARIAANPYLHVAVSGTANPADATVRYTVGKVISYAAVLNGRIDVEVNLADPSLSPGASSLATATDPTAAALPTYDPLYEPNTDDLPTAAIQARTASWNTDPVTHVISLDDWTTSSRVVNLGSGGFNTEVSYRPAPVKHIKARLVATWQQEAKGIVDVAPLIAQANSGTGGRMLSLSTERLEGPGGGAVDFANSAGWSQDATRQRRSYGASEGFWSGRTIEVDYQLETTTYVANENGGFDSVVVKGSPFSQRHDEYWSLYVNQVSYLWFYCSYAYSQQRTETLDLVMDMDVQTTTLGGDTLDLGTITLGDLLQLPGYPVFELGNVYMRGDRVMVAGEAFECLNDYVTVFYRFAGKWSPSRLAVTSTAGPVGPYPDWKRLGTCAPLADRRLPSYFDTARGRGSVAHMLLRMRAAGLARMRHVVVSRTYRWQDAGDVDLVDRVRMVIREGDTTRVVVGKVEAIERVLDGKKGGTVRVTIAASLGTGRNDAVANRPLAGTYGGAGYFPPDYHAISQPVWLAPGYEVDDATVYSAGKDVEFSVTLDPLIVPVDATRLQDPNYSIVEVSVRNPAYRQVAIMQGRSAMGGDPREITKEYPTTLKIAPRPLISEGTLQRFGRVHAQLTYAPLGTDLANPMREPS